MKKVLFLFCYIIFNLVFCLTGGLCEDYTIKEYLDDALPTQEGRKIVLNESLGFLTVTDTLSNQKLIKELIEVWDVGPRQIAIEARFVEISMSDLGEFGVEWLGEKSDTAAGGSVNRRNKRGDFLIGPGVTSTIPDNETVVNNPATVGTGDLLTATGALEGTRPLWTGTEFGAPTDLSGLGVWLGKTTISGSQLFSYLRALETTGRASLLSAPKVTTLSGQMANIELARIFPYATSVKRTDTEDAFGIVETYKIDERKVGIFLEVTPVVGKDSKVISLDIHPEVTDVVKKASLVDSDQFPVYLGWPVIDSRSAQTTVSVESGETVIIGGLMKDEQTVTNRRVPILGYIPLFGNLFKYKYVSRNKTNLVIFLTATIISAEGEEIR
ncbi:MAG: hypothetical protein ABH836_08635 [Candidatus Omnitrophota bacterium]